MHARHAIPTSGRSFTKIRILKASLPVGEAGETDAGCTDPGEPSCRRRRQRPQSPAFSQLESKQILDKCLRCHAETLSRANIRRSRTLRTTWCVRTATPFINPRCRSFCWPACNPSFATAVMLTFVHSFPCRSNTGQRRGDRLHRIAITRTALSAHVEEMLKGSHVEAGPGE